MDDYFYIELKEHLSQVLINDNVDMVKFYNELFHFFCEKQNEFVFRKYQELKKNGYKNKEIYTMIQEMHEKMLFRGSRLSTRQIKRIIYKE